jgi:hypothetical protein
MIYRSQKVWWSALLFVAPALAGLIVGVGLIAMPLMAPALEPARVPLMIGGAVAIVAAAIPVWFYLSISYEITPEDLIVRFGPIRLRYRLSSIAEAIPTRVPLGPAWSFATSWDMVYIRFRSPDGRAAGQPLAISPANKAEFLRELAERGPGLGGLNEGTREDSTRLEP